MVFESLVADVLNKFLGDYVENLDRSQLKIGIWGGDVVLQNLQLKENALADLNLPIRAVAGRLGNLVLKIPWKSLYTSPVVATIENLELLAVPSSDAKYDPVKEEKAKKEAKKKELQRIEDAKRWEAEKAKAEQSQDSFTEKLVSQIIKNLQVRVADIHIRYEDCFTNPKRPFAFGVTLHNLLFETTNKNWEIGPADNSDKFIYKLISLDSLSFYWNSNQILYSKLTSSELHKKLQEGIAASQHRPNNIMYVLGPINSIAKLQLNQKPELDGSNYTIPKVSLTIEMQEIALSLSKFQYQDVMELLQSLERIAAASLYRQYHPNVPLKGNAKKWWKFAYDCVLESGVRRLKSEWSWEHIHKHRSLCHRYKQLYRDKLQSKKLSDNIRKELESLEDYLDVLNITLARKQAEVEYERLGLKAKSEESYTGWISSFLPWNKEKKPNEESGLVKKFEEAMTADEKSKLYQAIDYQENAAPTIYPRMFVENKLQFYLHNLTVMIKDDSVSPVSREVMKFSLSEVRSGIEMRPSAQAIKIMAEVGGLAVFGCKSDGSTPIIVQSLTHSDSESVSLLKVLFETNPLGENSNQKIRVRAQPLEIIYHADTINQLTDVFKPPESVALSGLQEAAKSSLKDFNELSATGLQHAISQQKILDLDIDILSSYVIIPENGLFTSKSHYLVADLGNLKMCSVARDPQAPCLTKLHSEGSTESEILQEMLVQAYDKFIICLTGMQILLACPGDEWNIVRGSSSSLHVLHPTNINMELQKCIFIDDPRLPKLKVKGRLPSFHLVLSDSKLLQLATVALSIPTPKGSDQGEISESQPEMRPLPVKPINVDVKRLATSDLSKSEDSSSTIQSSSVQVTNLELVFEIEKVGLTIARQHDDHKDFCNFAVLNLGVAVTQHPYDMTVSMYVGGLTMEAPSFPGINGGPLYIVSTPMTDGSTEKLFSFFYQNANRKGPDFNSSYQSTEQLIQLKFSKLNIVLHQEVILEAISLANSIQAKVEEIKKRVHPEPESSVSLRRRRSSALSSVYEFAKAAKRPRRMKKMQIEDSIINVKLDAEMESFSLAVCTCEKAITDICIKGLKTAITVQQSKTTVAARLKTVVIYDPHSSAFYKEILSFEEDDAFDVKLINFNDATVGPKLDLSAVDISVSASVGGIHLVFLNKFVAEVMDFVNHFQMAKEKVIEASSAAAEAAKQNMQNVYQKATRIKLNFRMKAPVIIIPQNSKSDNVLVADLGLLKLNNKFCTCEGFTTSQPIFDNIEIGLENLKLSRAITNPMSGSILSECLLLEPMTFTLKLKRNLTINWYKEAPEVDIMGKLAAVNFLMTHEDFCLIMNVLNENLSEGQSPESFAKKEEKQAEVASAAVDLLIEQDETEEVTVFKRITFNFEMESFTLQLFSGSSYLHPYEPEKRLTHPLAKFELTMLAVNGEMLSDNALWTKLVLIKCLLNDTRAARLGGIKRLLEVINFENKKMLDIVFKRDTVGNTFLDATVSSITLVLCVDYLMMLANFFTEGMTSKTDQASVTPAKGALPKKQQPKSSHPPTSNTTVVFKLEKPDIIIVQNMDDIDSPGIIFNNEIRLTLKLTPELQNMMVTIANLQLMTCCYNPEKRASTMAEILSPCHISVTSNTPFGEGLRLDVNVTDVIIHVTPSTIQLLSSIGSSFAAKPTEIEKSDVLESKDYHGLWEEKSLSENEFWFIKTEEATEAIELLSADVFSEDTLTSAGKGEQMILEVKTIILTIETGEGLRTVPMITWESSFTGEIKDWSNMLHVGCSFNMEIAYYNEKMAVFEPLIEPVDVIKAGRPWELIVELKKNDQDSPAILPDEDIEEVQFAPAALTLNVISQDVLELTVTKSALEVFANLGKAFGEAVSNSIPVKKELPSSPYTVKNETGLPISLILRDQEFEVYSNSPGSIEEVVLEVGTSVPLILKNSFSPNRSSLIRTQDLKEEHNLMIKIDQMGILRPLAVTKADKRYYPLPQRTYPGDQWGMVTEVTSKYGYKTITLRSNVQIINHISVPVEVYYMTEGGNEVQFCGQIESYGTLNLPLFAVYTKTNEIFFRPNYNGYTVSIVPFIWKELQKNPGLRKVLQCNPRENGGQPFFMNVIGEIEQVYFENSNKKTITSTCYKINLHPTAVLCNMLPHDITYSFTGTSEESVLEEGHSKELLTAELNVTEINIKIPNYMNHDWYCNKKLMTHMEEVWTFETKGQMKQNLDLGVHILCDSGFLHMFVYCPFWMMNKTGVTLHYRRTRKAERSSSLGSPSKENLGKRRQSLLSLSEVNEDSTSVISHPPNMDFPVMFSFRPKVFFSKKKASLKVENSEWSDKFSLDTVGSSGTVKCCNKSGNSYEVGVQIRLSNLGLSKIIIFSPYYLIVNNAHYDIECCETLSTTDEWILLPAGQCSPFWPKYYAKKKELILRVASMPERTKPFSYEQAHTTLLQLNNCKGGLGIECQITEASAIITINEYTNGLATVHLVNHCVTASISFSQSGFKEVHTLNPKSHMLYTWEDPSGQRELIWFASTKGKMKNSLVKDGIGEYEGDSKELLYWVSFLDDTQRVLMFTDDLALATTAQCANEFETVEQEVLVSLQGIGLSLIDDSLRREIAYIGLASSGIIWESCKLNSRRFRPFNVKECMLLEAAHQKYLNEIKLKKKPKKRVVLDKLEVDFEAEMLYRPNQRKIRRIYQPGLWFQYKTSPHQLQFHAKFNRLQVDNQLDDCTFPTVVAPVPLPKSVAADTVPKPFTEACIILRKNEHSSVQQFKYFKVLVQEFHIKLDQSFINALITLFSQAAPSESKKLELFEQDKKVAQMDLKELTAITSSQEQKHFYDILHFSPLKVHVSFSMQGGGNSDDPKQPTPIHSDFLNLLLQSFGVTLTEIQDVVFKLAFFEKQHVFLTQKQLTAEAIRHYTAQAIKQMYVLILGLDVIGNPFGLVMGLGKGVEDLFYEPFQGAVQGPEEFAEGLALGIKSLFGHAVGGAAGAVSRITGTLGKGVAALTMDAEYQRKRREALNRRPANLQEGLARSGKGLVMGVFDGVTGVFVKPIEGAKEEGVEGFFKGVGKGVVGLVTRPTSGVIDFASGSLEAVKRVADFSEEIHRLRPPRYFQSDGIVRPYNRYEAEGNKLLKELEKGKFALTDHYLAHVVVTQDGKAIFVVTDKRLIMISKGEIFGQWNCEWNHTWDEIKQLPHITGKGLEIPLKETKKKVLGLFSSSHSGKIVEIKDPAVSSWILTKIELAMKRCV